MDLFPAPKKDDGNAPPAPAPDDPAAGVLPSFREALAHRTWLLSLAGPVAALAGLGTRYITHVIFERSFDRYLAVGNIAGLTAIRTGMVPAIIAAAVAAFGVFTGIVARSNRITFVGVYMGLAVGAIAWVIGDPEAAVVALVFLAPPLCGTFICWTAGMKRPWKPGCFCGSSGGFMAMASLIPLIVIVALLSGIFGSFYRVEDFFFQLFALSVPPYLGAWIFFHALRRGCFIWRGIDPKPRSQPSKDDPR
jgi:hypothetical protein